MHVSHRGRRQFLRASLALAGAGLLAACGLSSAPLGPRSECGGLASSTSAWTTCPPRSIRCWRSLHSWATGRIENLAVDWRNLPNEAAAMTAAREFVGNGVDLIVAFENQTMRAVREATSDHPGRLPARRRPGRERLGPEPGAPWRQPDRLRRLARSARQADRVLQDAGPVASEAPDPLRPRRPGDATGAPVARKAAAALGIELVEREGTTLESIEQVFADLRPGERGRLFIASRNLQTNFTLPIVRLGPGAPPAGRQPPQGVRGRGRPLLLRSGSGRDRAGARTSSPKSWRGRGQPICPSSSATTSSW